MESTSDIFSERDDGLILQYKMPLKRFVQAKVGEDGVIASSSLRGAPISGCTVKESYLTIVGTDAVNARCEPTHSPITLSEVKKKKKKPNTITSVNSVMKAVETNDVSKVVEFIEADKEFVLSVRDQYGWSALMNACCAGAKGVVKLLLRHDPDLNVTDRKGNTCLKLAVSKGHTNIVKLLQDHKGKKNDAFEVGTAKSDTATFNSFYCEACKETVTNSAQSHFTSTVHLFNSSKKSGMPTFYGIPENNVGFQMLLKTGWDREKGLGPGGSGQKFPPKTALKQDRAGLGAKKYVARVTHDHNLIGQDRSERQRTLNRRERLRNEMKSKRKERELRRMLD